MYRRSRERRGTGSQEEWSAVYVAAVRDSERGVKSSGEEGAEDHSKVEANEAQT